MNQRVAHVSNTSDMFQTKGDTASFSNSRLPKLGPSSNGQSENSLLTARPPRRSRSHCSSSPTRWSS